MAIHSTNAIHADADSFERDSSPSVLPDHPRHSQRYSPERPRPLRTDRPHPQRGQGSGRPPAPKRASAAVSSAMATLSYFSSVSFFSRFIFDVVRDRMGSMGPPGFSVSCSIPMIQEVHFTPIPRMRLCQR